MIKVSIIITCYNDGKYLLESLDSAIRQTYKDIEIIIINDGSTDRLTLDILSKINNERVKIVSTLNAGVSAARNTGISLSTGRLVLTLDADDILDNSYVENAVAIFASNSKIRLVSSDTMMFGNENRLVRYDSYDMKMLLFSNSLHSSSIYHKDDWVKCGGYSTKMTHGWEDWDFWISMKLPNYSVIKIDKPLLYYRIKNHSRNSSMSLSEKFAMYLQMIFRNKWTYIRHFPSFFTFLSNRLSI